MANPAQRDSDAKRRNYNVKIKKLFTDELIFHDDSQPAIADTSKKPPKSTFNCNKCQHKNHFLHAGVPYEYPTPNTLSRACVCSQCDEPYIIDLKYPDGYPLDQWKYEDSLASDARDAVEWFEDTDLRLIY